MGWVVLVLPSLRSCWSCLVAVIFRLAGCEAGSVVGSPRGWFCVGTLHVDICAVGVIGSKVVSGEYVKNECVLTCLSGRRCWREAVM